MIPMNYEVDDVVRFVKSRRLEWLGDVRRVDGGRTSNRIADWKAVGRRIEEDL